VPLEVLPPARQIPVPGTPPPPVEIQRPPTIQEFVASFKPCPGNYEVVLTHPHTCRPVKVCFTLPEGCPRVKIKGLLRKCVDFNYGRCDVQIWFLCDGRVRVNN
jgi:hypothetical protein